MSFPRVKRLGLGVDHPPYLVEIYLYTPTGLSWRVIG
jgi:hypothetical protein